MVPLVDPNVVKPGWTAAIIVLVLIGATFFLWRNMGRQLKKIDFQEIGRRPDEDADGADGADEKRDASGSADGDHAVDQGDGSGSERLHGARRSDVGERQD